MFSNFLADRKLLDSYSETTALPFVKEDFYCERSAESNSVFPIQQKNKIRHLIVFTLFTKTDVLNFYTINKLKYVTQTVDWLFYLSQKILNIRKYFQLYNSLNLCLYIWDFWINYSILVSKIHILSKRLIMKLKLQNMNEFRNWRRNI